MNVYGVEFCRLSVERVSELLENFKPETVPFNEKILAPRSGINLKILIKVKSYLITFSTPTISHLKRLERRVLTLI